NMILHTRGSVPVERLIDRARGYVAAIDAELPVQSARSLADHLRGAFIFYELTATMLFVFGVSGMALAGLGTYGLVSYIVKQSTHEIGIRMALGASGSSVVRRFLSRGLRLGAIGAAIGVVAAVGLGGLLQNVLYGVSATDAPSFARALAGVISGLVVATILSASCAALRQTPPAPSAPQTGCIPPTPL